MKVRIKFTKDRPYEICRSSGHHALLPESNPQGRLPVAFSGGYSPHMIMSFAAPSGCWNQQVWEYFDMELTETRSYKEIEKPAERCHGGWCFRMPLPSGGRWQGKHGHGSCGSSGLFCTVSVMERSLAC